MTKPAKPAGIAALLMVGGLSCIPEPAPGEYGIFRYVGNVRGATPLQLLPPISDREGNAYVLYGDINLLEVQLFIGHFEGGWDSINCDITFGNDYGAHGFVGRAQQRAWYWSGEALVEASGRTGACRRLLEKDPSSGSRLNFRAVIPWVRETPSRTSTVAWIQAPTDPRPFHAVIDLDRRIYTNIDEFEPRDAENVEILGVGGHAGRREGVVLVRYTQGTALRVQARFFDEDGEQFDEASISGLDTLPQYGVLGYLQSNDEGLYAGLDSEGQLILLDDSGGQRRGVGGMTPAGVHRWKGQLYLVGENGGGPVIAHIDDDGDIGKVEEWDASVEAVDELGGSIDVVDDRNLPSTDTEWRSPRTAIGSFPFLSPHSLDEFASKTTTWLIAGPTFSAGGEDRTAIAYVPVGIAYEDE